MNKYHLIGIGGIGMSALARIAHERGHFVQGSECQKTPLSQQLSQEGVQVHYTSCHGCLSSDMQVVFSSAISQTHIEYQEAINLKLPLLHRSDLLQHLMQESVALLIAGTHGKTSTASLLTHVLQQAGWDPTYALGGILLSSGRNGHQGTGSFFVAEADESDGTFCKYSGFAAIITNIEEEHTTFWTQFDDLVKGFLQFASQISDHLLWCHDDPVLRSLNLKGISYGFSLDADIQITRSVQKGWYLEFDLKIQGKQYLAISLPLIGKHHVLNGAAVFGLALLLGMDEEVIRKGFNQFKGVKRRMEKKGENQGVMIFDDYAHHPTEIKTTLQGLKIAVEEKRIVAIFEPHRFSRLKHAWNEFLEAFDRVDHLFVTDVEAAGESFLEGINGSLFAQALEQKGVSTEFVKREDLLSRVGSYLRPHDVCITLGAGSITYLSDQLLTYPISPFSLFFIQGGESAEHEVALLSAQQVKLQLSSSYYNMSVWTISKEGKWFFKDQQQSLQAVLEALLASDFAFPLLHGAFGEDGMIQGFLETAKIPYVGCDFRSAAVCMDKAWSKQIVSSEGVFIAPFMEFTVGEWTREAQEVKQKILGAYTFPFYIKAVHLGSTFGVFRVKEEQEIAEAIEAISKLDYKFIVEEEVIGREIEFGLIGDEWIEVSHAAEVIRKEEVHSYENKYSSQGNPAILKTQLPPLLAAEGKAAAKAVYKALGCSGLARIDFFLTPEGRWVFNEINPMPGLTPMSVYPAMWKAEGMTMATVLDRVIIASLHRDRRQKRHLRPPKKPPIDL
ncbi:MAG: UDP-N-acetylmuramate--L-alanine ligase [Candidatus Rhabdochlamydia sp.]